MDDDIYVDDWLVYVARIAVGEGDRIFATLVLEPMPEDMRKPQRLTEFLNERPESELRQRVPMCLDGDVLQYGMARIVGTPLGSKLCDYVGLPRFDSDLLVHLLECANGSLDFRDHQKLGKLLAGAFDMGPIYFPFRY